eukprot:COSAG05_NODE_1347_length_5118_cov_5.195258_7_plen_154_part_00
MRYNQAQLQLQLRNPDEALDHLAGGLHLPALLRRVERRELAVDIHHPAKVLVVVRVDAAINRARLRSAFERTRQGGGSDTTTARSPHFSWETLCVSWHICRPHLARFEHDDTVDEPIPREIVVRAAARRAAKEGVTSARQDDQLASTCSTERR